MLLNDKIDEFVTVIESGTPPVRYSNVFLTNSWKLYIDHNEDQHNVALDRLRIAESSVYVSGYYHEHGLSIRSPHCVDTGEVSEEMWQMMVSAVRRIVKQRLSLRCGVRESEAK